MELASHLKLTEEPNWASRCIHAAAIAGTTEMIAHLSQCGADVNSCTARGLTPLHYATR